MNDIKGIGGTFIKAVKRTLKVGHDNTGWIEVNGKRFYVLSTAITANVTTTDAPAGSEGRTTHATGRGKIFTSDGTKWQAFLAITPLQAGAHVAALTDNSGGATADGTIDAVTNSFAGYVYYQNIPAATTSAAADQLSLNGVSAPATMANLLQPKIPRNLKINITDANASISAYSITIVGVGPDGSAVTETFNFASGLTPAGSKIFATITSVTLNSIVGSGSGDTLDLGYGVKIGVPVPAGATGLSIVKLVSNGTAEAASATDTTNNSFTATTAPNGTNDYEIWYKYAHPAATALSAAVKELSTKVNQVISALEGNAVLADV